MTAKATNRIPRTAPAERDYHASPVVIYLYVENVDEAIERAVAGDAQILVPVENQFWGDRIAWIMDPAGHVWTVATGIEESSAGEGEARWSGILKETAQP